MKFAPIPTVIAAGAVALAAFGSHALADPTPQEINELRAMHLVAPDTVRLPSHSTLGHLRSGFDVALGHEAIRMREIVDGVADSAMEADAIGPDGKSELAYAWFNDGYVSLDDWKTINPDEIMNGVKESTDAANDVRRAKGLPTMEVTGWKQKPLLDQQNNAVTWAIEGVDSTGVKVINAIALKLGRFGFERITWYIDPALYQSNDLALAVNDFKFDPGARYGDYEPGKDRAATYGIAGLVAGLITGKTAAKLGLLAGLAVFGKKFVVIIGIALVALFGRIKRMFSPKAQSAV
jgi:uncharacterized membrane-anchored protein